MRNYEVTFIVDPVQDGKDIKAVAQKYVDQLQEAGCKIIQVNEMGLRELAYQIKKRTSGVYYCVEFEAVDGTVISPMELQMRRDDSILRFLTVSLDKFGVKYNQDKRDGKIGVAKKIERKQPPSRERGGRNQRGGNRGKNQNQNRNQNPNRNQQQAAPAAPKPAPTPPPAAAEEEE